MVRRFAAAVLLLALATAAIADDGPVTLRVTAIKATDENRPQKVYDPALNNVKEPLSALHYDTFKIMKHVNAQAKLSEETKIPLDDRYTLVATPNKRDEDGRVHIAFRIEERAKEDDPKIIVPLEFKVSAMPEKNIVQQGLPLRDGGTLVLVISVAK